MDGLRIAAWIIGGILVISLLQFIVSIHPPRTVSKITPADYNLDYQNVSFLTSDTIRIQGWFIEGENPKGTIIVGHGYPFDKGNIMPVALFLHPDYNLLFYDHRFFGESEGSISTVGINEPKDVEAAVNWVTHNHPGPIGLYGFSLSASSMLMANVSVDAIVSDSAFANLGMMVDRIYNVYGPLRYPFVWATEFYSFLFFGMWPDSVSPARALAESSTPTFVIHGTQDSQIPVSNAHTLEEAGPTEVWIIDGADHGETTLHKEYETRVNAFFSAHLS